MLPAFPRLQWFRHPDSRRVNNTKKIVFCNNQKLLLFDHHQKYHLFLAIRCNKSSLMVKCIHICTMKQWTGKSNRSISKTPIKIIEFLVHCFLAFCRIEKIEFEGTRTHRITMFEKLHKMSHFNVQVKMRHFEGFSYSVNKNRPWPRKLSVVEMPMRFTTLISLYTARHANFQKKKESSREGLCCISSWWKSLLSQNMQEITRL